jgi:hypothetical protein
LNFKVKKKEILLVAKEYFINWKNEFLRHKYSLLLALFFLIITGILNYFSGVYTNKVGVSTSPDLILDYLPVINLELLYVYGYLIILAIFILYPLLFRINKLHRVISQLSFLIMIRSIFISLTHLKAPTDAILVDFPGIMSHMSFQNDLFFSGHVAVPFLGFLLFKDSKIKYFFLVASILMGITVLFMHVHYSIDVFSAFFISYGIYKIGEWLLNLVKK